MTKKAFLIFMVAVLSALSVCHSNAEEAQPSPQVRFQVVAAGSEKPIRNQDICVFNGDYKLKSGPGFEPYPCNDTAQDMDWFIGKVTTDIEGTFSFNIKDVKARDIYFKVGTQPRVISIEKSSDIRHMPSDSHIRIVRFDEGDTKVKRNDIYDLKRKTVVKIWLDGRIEAETFENVLLIAQ